VVMNIRAQAQVKLKMTTSFFFLVVVAALVLALVRCDSVKVWLTTSDPQSASVIKLLEPQQERTLSFEKTQQDVTITIDSSTILQKIVGYGAGMPQSSASVLVNLKRNNYELYGQVMEKLFGTSESGARISAVRFPVGSCDFSIHNTTYDESYNDFDLRSFAIDADSEMIVEVLRDAMMLNPSLVLIGRSV
jgi:O-glycosyl hydrolase